MDDKDIVERLDATRLVITDYYAVDSLTPDWVLSARTDLYAAKIKIISLRQQVKDRDAEIDELKEKI